MRSCTNVTVALEDAMNSPLELWTEKFGSHVFVVMAIMAAVLLMMIVMVIVRFLNARRLQREAMAAGRPIEREPSAKWKLGLIALVFIAPCLAGLVLSVLFSLIGNTALNRYQTQREETRPQRVKDLVDSLDFVLVEGGCFDMGCDINDRRCEQTEKPRHRVCVDDFWLMTREVSFEQYFAFAHETSNHPDITYSTNRAVSKEDPYPAADMAWGEAVTFTVWLSRETGMTYRLPTEAEWEYACRGGGKEVMYGTSDGTLSRSKLANLGSSYRGDDKDGFLRTAPVDSYPPNALGLHNMTGNVAEWVLDSYKPDAYWSRRGVTEPLSNPVHTASGFQNVFDVPHPLCDFWSGSLSNLSRKFRYLGALNDCNWNGGIRRGGGWDDKPKDARCTSRDGGGRSSSTGFRLVREVAPRLKPTDL
jgi:formylglycine-generating enzyme required for sulfatase activity